MSTAQEPGAPERSPRRKLVVPAVFAGVIALLGIVALGLRALGGSTPPGGPVPETTVTHAVLYGQGQGSGTAQVACAMARAAGPRVPGAGGPSAPIVAPPPTRGAPATRYGDGADLCRRIAADMAGRAPLDARQRAAISDVATRVMRAVAPVPRNWSRGPCTMAASRIVCAMVPAPVTPADVPRVRQLLAAAGFHDVVVRLARTGDPAPAGALLYAVGAGPGCVIGIDSGSAAVGTRYVAGRLPSGACLRP